MPVLRTTRRLALVAALGACQPTTPAAEPSEEAAAEPSTGVAAEPSSAAQQEGQAEEHTFSLVAARAAITTQLARSQSPNVAPTPPEGVFEMVRYPAPMGDSPAYITPVRDDGPHPAILWISGGFNWGLYDGMWTEGPRENDQSGAVLLGQDLVVMRAALRGQTGSPGNPECFLGEVDDVLAAADFLAARPDVDPDRVYIGGHSTGGVVALLALESTDRFAAGFAFGPESDPAEYNRNCPPRDLPADELRARAPIHWIDEVTTPTWIVEGAERGNAAATLQLGEAGSDAVTAFVVPGANHFSVLRPGMEAMLVEILKPDPADITFTLDAITSRL